MKMIFTKAAILLIILTVVNSCSKDDDPVVLVQPIELDCSLAPNEGETLTLEDLGLEVDYLINCVYTIDGDFIIEPGVSIQFGTDAGLKVRGTGSIEAVGGALNQIVFTGEDKIAGSWRGIFIDSNDLKNKIENATVEYAGGEAFNSNGDKGAVIVWADAHLEIKNSTIRNSATYGFNANYGGANIRLDNNKVTTCDAPMYIEGEYVTSITDGNYTGNTLDAIIVTLDQITGDHNWRKLDVPYHLPGGMQVIPGGNLTIQPGVIMGFGQASELYINEGASGPKPSLVAVGTMLEPIVFTSIDQTLGAWNGIYFDSPSTLNEIGFATIENASNANQEGAIETWYNTFLNVHDVYFRDIQNCAIKRFTSTGSPNNVSTSGLSFENVTNTICDN